MRKPLTLLVLLPAVALSVAGKKDKGAKEPESGWVVVNAETGGSCYKTPDFKSMPEGPGRLARAAAIGEIIGQWNGQRSDGVQFSEQTANNVETVLLGDPDDVDVMGPENYDWCKKVMSGKATASDWESWASGQKARLTKGECKGSLLPQTMYDYLDIGAGWQIPAPFCKDDEIVIEVSPKDYFRIEKGGPWINAAGDTSQPAKSGLPCTLEGCYKGTVIMRFVSDEGMEIIEPVGTGRVWKAPAHGVITVMINDNDFNENEWKVEAGMQHHASVGYSPK
ncbi:MAG: hypothetical protein H6737_29090 [Alphaproteobacteria bacterium]|nr:hypothetical protein [Alphaproteobacteria bacterium]